jgi:hypothetical protein
MSAWMRRHGLGILIEDSVRGTLVRVVLGLALGYGLSWASHAHADIIIDAAGRTTGAPVLRSYTPNGTAHLQGLTICDKTVTDRCITVDSSGAIQVSIIGTIPVTISSAVLPTGAATAAKQPQPGGPGSASTEVLSIQGVAGMTPVQTAVSGTVTVAVSGSTLPTGAATAAKQPALGFAGSASVDVITVQGIASMTPLLASITTALPTGNNVIGHVICDSGCSGSGGGGSTFAAAFPAAGQAIGFTDGTNMQPGRVRTSTPGASDVGLVVRPMMMTDGTNVMPTGDASARSIHVTVDNGSATATENSNLTLGTAAVAETIALSYGAVVLTPSTMTLGTNGTGMRRTTAAAGQTIVQTNAPIGDWTGGKANATGTADTSLVAALGSGVKFCLTDWMATNDSATDSSFRFRDGSTDLTERIMVPTKGGNQKALVTPICGTANTAFQFAADTGVTTMRVTVRGYKTKE